MSGLGGLMELSGNTGMSNKGSAGYAILGLLLGMSGSLPGCGPWRMSFFVVIQTFFLTYADLELRL